MSKGLDLAMLRARALLMRSTSKVNELGCRTAEVAEVELDGRTTKVEELGYYCRTGRWAVAPLCVSCGTPDCVIHLDVEPDEADVQLVADLRPVRSLAQMFRFGRSRGWFRGTGGYAA
jgi:hypothetical protein